MGTVPNGLAVSLDGVGGEGWGADLPLCRPLLEGDANTCLPGTPNPALCGLVQGLRFDLHRGLGPWHQPDLPSTKRSFCFFVCLF
jgi:hypothetical protein